MKAVTFDKRMPPSQANGGKTVRPDWPAYLLELPGHTRKLVVCKSSRMNGDPIDSSWIISDLETGLMLVESAIGLGRIGAVDKAKKQLGPLTPQELDDLVSQKVVKYATRILDFKGEIS